MTPYLSVTNLECQRNEQNLFANISFSLLPSEIMHITGANGVGKSTLLRCLAGLSEGYQGQICWQNDTIHDNDLYKNNLLFLGHKNGIKSQLTVIENLQWSLELAHVLPHEDITKVLIQLKLDSKRDFPAAQLSAGQKQRLALGKLLLSKAKLWILDEPLTSLDKEGLDLTLDIMQQHLDNQGMIIFTSHTDICISLKKYAKIELKPLE